MINKLLRANHTEQERLRVESAKLLKEYIEAYTDKPCEVDAEYGMQVTIKDSVYKFNYSSRIDTLKPENCRTSLPTEPNELLAFALEMKDTLRTARQAYLAWRYATDVY